MKLIAEKLDKSAKCDRLRFIRADGSEAACVMPRQGTLPHDLVHYVVESALPLRHGFLSLVAAGSDPTFTMKSAHDPANDTIETEAVQAEAIVEALQTQLWAGTFDETAFLEGARLAATERAKPPFTFTHIQPEALYQRAIALLQHWSATPFHQCMELQFVGGKG